MGSDPSSDLTGTPVWLGIVRRRVASWRAEGVGPGWVVAVSGGGDSLAMLLALLALRDEFGLRLSVAHLDHGVRGEAAHADARFVADLSDSFGLPCDLGSWRPTRAGHFEADARAARLAWLGDVAKARDAAAVAVGHNRDDQAETILHRIVRGTGPRGLTGIPARRSLTAGVALVRPLLDVSRKAIRDELARLGREPREDASNLDTHFTRARIRHDLIPKLEADYNPAAVAAIVRLGESAAAERRLLEALLAPIAAAVIRSVGPDRIAFDRRAVAGLDPAVAVETARRAWREAGWPERSMSARRWRRLAACLVAGEAAGQFGAGASLHVEGDLLMLDRPSPADAAPEIGPVILEAPGTCAVPWAAASFRAVDDPSGGADEVVDSRRVAFPLTVRVAAHGEKFDPLGMRGRRQRLVEFLRLRGVPRDDRGRIPVVSDRLGIVWVVGHRIADRVRTTDATTSRLGLSWDGPKGA